MIFMYGCYLVFQLGTHKEEFDDEENVVESADGHQLHLSPHFTSRHGRQTKARRNNFCLLLFNRLFGGSVIVSVTENGDVELIEGATGHQLLPTTDDDGSLHNAGPGGAESDTDSDVGSDGSTGGKLLPQNEISKSSTYANGYFDEYPA